MNPADRAPAIALLLAHNEHDFALKGNFRIIDDWIKAGADMLLDVVPTLKTIIARREASTQPKINNIAYFTPMVLDAKDRRLSVNAAKSIQQTISIDYDAREAKRIEICKRFGRFVSSREEQWLAKYEALNFGTVPVSTTVNE